MSNSMDEELLSEQVQNELKKHFKQIDQDILSYLLGVLNNNKEDFTSPDDIEEAIGAILQELVNDAHSKVNVSDLCSRFHKLLRW